MLDALQADTRLEQKMHGQELCLLWENYTYILQQLGTEWDNVFWIPANQQHEDTKHLERPLYEFLDATSVKPSVDGVNSH